LQGLTGIISALIQTTRFQEIGEKKKGEKEDGPEAYFGSGNLGGRGTEAGGSHLLLPCSLTAFCALGEKR
jgi:hypothetical protein